MISPHYTAHLFLSNSTTYVTYVIGYFFSVVLLLLLKPMVPPPIGVDIHNWVDFSAFFQPTGLTDKR